MAYINSEEVKQIRNKLKTEFPQLKFSVVNEHSMSVSVSIMKSNIDFQDILKGDTDKSINHYHIDQYGKHKPMFLKMIDIIQNGSDKKWYNKSDSMTDYFDVAFYFDLNIGRWDRPYELTK
jgi:predicted ATP-binding protein involved in virulence